jgi:hypothetical protein
MQATAMTQGSAVTGWDVLVVLRDALGRVLRAHEALVDGDREFGLAVLDDLAADLWREVERQEKAA